MDATRESALGMSGWRGTGFSDQAFGRIRQTSSIRREPALVPSLRGDGAGGGGVDEDGGEEDDREAAILLEVAGDFAVWPSRMDSWVGDLLGRCRVPNSCRERQRGMA